MAVTGLRAPALWASAGLPASSPTPRPRQAFQQRLQRGRLCISAGICPSYYGEGFGSESVWSVSENVSVSWETGRYAYKEFLTETSHPSGGPPPRSPRKTWIRDSLRVIPICPLIIEGVIPIRFNSFILKLNY